MASRSHVDVNERRLRPIYDCLDNGNNKKAIQEADKVLKKQKDLTCAKVLKALALLRMGRQAEGTAILAAIHESEPTEEQTLNAMSICYKEAQQYNKIASLYEAASKHQPNNEDILSCLFMAHVRLGNYQQQQRTAMLLHKLRPNKNPYYFWAVMSIVMQAHKNEEQKKPIFLTLAEKMTRKYIEEDKIEAEAEILLYLIILELQEKWDEALKVLEGPLGEQLGNELNLRETRLANVCTKLGIWDKVNSIYKKLLNHTPDDWLFWLKYLDSGFHLADGSTPSQEDGDKSAVTPDCSLESMLAYIKEKISEMQDGVLLRGPYLAEIEFLKRLLQRKSDFAATVGSALNLLQEYYKRFGQKACCYTDMKLYVDLLNPEEEEQFVQYMKTNAGLDSSDGDTLNLAADINQLTKHLVYIQLTRYMGRHIKLETEEALSLSQELLIRYRDGLKFGESLLSTDLQYSDNYLLLAVHLLLDVWTKTGDDIHLWRAIVHLELGIKKSTSNYQMKLLLIRLYCIKGVFGPCPALYDGMEIKHIMNDTMGHIVSNHVIRLGHFMEAGTMYATMVRFFVVNQKEASEHLMSSYKFGSFGRIQEFVEFQERLDNALQYHSANTEKMLLELIMQTDRHDSTELAVDCMNVHPLTDSPINISKLRDNRDLTIALCWDPPSLLNSEENKVRSIQEEELWLSLRWTLLHILLLSVMVGKEITGASVVNGSGTNSDESLENKKERTLAITVLNQRMLELEILAKSSDSFLEPRQYHTVQGPFRTRISEFLREPHIGALSSMVQCINYIHKLTASGLEISNPNDEKCWTKVQEFSSKLVVKDIGGLVKDHQGKRQLDSSALEQIVASVETISYLTILAGVCNRGLKFLKIGLTKKSKKGKGPTAPLPETFENFNNLIKELSATTKELHQIASGLDPVFSSLDIASLRLADIPEEEELQREAERLVWNKVERSVQQSSREICEVLHHKQFYLNTLMV
ncbi:N-alpha-acetyltransferase 25, NatB auxiliary subunit-like [Physella acuta]|uniref:N-alpha-acetyltransferase 25, NatB auxiliary subunit-like n=1 Tax=Physella acuta TaxID=109671 RepID=UPI0027DE1622|nr:N-alpha-acetyltransferase 25, NatB auxiliary subunit-like [Physella acuta]